MQSVNDLLNRTWKIRERDAEKRRAVISLGLATLSGRKGMDKLSEIRVDHTSDVAVF